jgi:hypothetical protein
MMEQLVIEAWISPLSAITPSLILHNLELAGIQLPHSLTVTIDRGHYDCMDTNYAVIVVDGCLPGCLPSRSVCCSFFSHSVTRDTDPGALHSHWIGNCYMHVGYNREAMCSYRHEAGRVKTWKRVDTHDDAHDDAHDAVSVEPGPVISTKKTKTKLKIIQLQKKVLLLRTELDVWKAEVRDLKAELAAQLSVVKADQVGLAQRHKEQEAWVKRANQCMQDWTHQQVIERLRILENAAAAPVPAASVPANPFDFKEICDQMPALDLIANHYQCAASNNGNNGDSSDDDDCFIQVVVEK